jgi:hypothetical protein
MACAGPLPWKFVPSGHYSDEPFVQRLLTKRVPLLSCMVVTDIRADSHVARMWDMSRAKVVEEIEGNGKPGVRLDRARGASVEEAASARREEEKSFIGVKRKADEVFAIRVSARVDSEPEEGEEVEEGEDPDGDGDNDGDRVVEVTEEEVSSTNPTAISTPPPLDRTTVPSTASHNIKGACLLRLQQLYAECIRQGGFEDMVCSPRVLEMAGYKIDLSSTETGGSAAAKKSEETEPATASAAAKVGSARLGGCEASDCEEGEEVEVDETDPCTANFIHSEEASGSAVAAAADNDGEDGERVVDVTTNRFPSGALGICSLDCEMCETEVGNELTRLSVVCPVSGEVLDMLVSRTFHCHHR